MKKKNFISRNSSAINFFLIVVATVLTGIYVNLLTGQLSQPMYSNDILAALKSLRWWNSIIIFIIFIFYIQYVVTNAPSLVFQSARKNIIENILEASAKSIVFPNTPDTTHIRSIVTVYDPKLNMRVTKFSYNAEPDPERTAEFAPDFGITGKAFSKKMVVIESLSPNHLDAYENDVKDLILSDLKTVIAAPIPNPNNPSEPPIGVLAFDSILSVSDLNFDQRQIKSLAQKWADTIGIVLSATPG